MTLNVIGYLLLVISYSKKLQIGLLAERPWNGRPKEVKVLYAKTTPTSVLLPE